MTDTIEGWVWEENLPTFLRHLSLLVDYSFDNLDLGAVETGMMSTDGDAGDWFDYPLVDTVLLSVALAQNPGDCPVSIRVTGADEVALAASVTTLLNVFSDVRVA